MARRGKKGALSPEDKELWGKVAKTLTPLDPDRMKTLKSELEEQIDKLPAQAGKPAKTATAITPPAPAKPAPPPPLHKLEHRYRKKLVRGVKAIDGRIDLHGLTQHQAHDRLRAFLHRAQARGDKIVLVITGKGGGPERAYMDERGVLRRMVPQWLAMPDLRPIVLGYEEAHQSHGGSGALYVRIRKRR
ncbi:DNA mismatch repair protein MutS [Roseibium denhamense]|uniref:DNA-nicking endonuclease, Smr domain n=1 Tax=Roseibium denhamense TaxID=76305 RepID=A0ABY1PBP1_9HYPH|nr:Smr/MutS family protein [Roseibium denhamense]MTI04175.1 DNA mismatch repair protein MutS [Roseibium denhamense]SMP30918.1 DNA-nicking endonuclease, Smr domain [Roseibium denhamense]